MCMLLRLFLFIVMVSSVFSFNFTYKMAAKCKEHVSQRGALYDPFYRINREKLKLNPGVEFEMHIAILAPSNGHILLSPVEKVDANTPVYEIVVGGGANKFSEIRRNKGKNAKMSAKTIDILSPIHFTAFYIRISNDGTIEFGKENESLPLLNYHDTDPLNINYFSFASWQGVEAKFLYDCPPPSAEEEEESPDSTLIMPELPNDEKLKSILLQDRTFAAPDPEMIVNFECIVTSIEYDAFEAKLVTGLSITLGWVDETLAWNPNKFNETSILKFKYNEIWRPYFTVKNAFSLEALDWRNPEPIYLLHSGEATLHFQTKVTTSCYDKTSYLSKWPRDEYECKIIIAPWSTYETINIRLTQNKNKILTDLDEVIENEWDLYQIVNNVLFKNASEDQVKSNDNLEISLFIRRHALPYNLVFYTPLVVLVTFLLLSFWTQPLVMFRVWFYVGCTTIMCTGLSYIEYLVPTHTLPSIVVLYTCVLMGNLIALLIQVILMHPFVKKHYKKMPKKTLSNELLRTIFCLKHRPSPASIAYENMNDSNDVDIPESSTLTRNMEEMESEDPGVSEEDEFVEVIDKLMFFVYSNTFAFLLVLHY